MPAERILLVEDNPGDRRVIQELLAEAGMVHARLDSTDSLPAALTLVSLPRYDLVLLDLSLPESRGLETFEAVHRAAPSLPIVVLTGSQDEELGREAVALGAQDFLDKNEITGPMLARSLTYAVERQQLLTRQLEVEEELRSKTRQLEAISETLETFLERGAWQEAVSLLVRRACELTGSPVGLVGAVQDRRYLEVFAARGCSGELAGTCLELSAAGGALESLVEAARPVSLAVTPGGPALPAELPPVESLLAVPILKGEEVEGMLAVAGRPGGYGPADLATLCVLARAGHVLHECHGRMAAEAALQERLRESQKMEAVGTLAAGVAHHFNNLLMIMMGNAELALTRLPADSPVRRHASNIRESGKRAAELIHHLIAYRSQPPEQPQPLDLNEVTAATLKLMQGVLPESVRIRCEPCGRACPIAVAPAELDQVLMNLVANARDAMPQGGDLTVETSHVHVDRGTAPKPGRYVMLSVSDTGGGMAPEVLARVFEPFFTTKALGRGTGLGLFTVWGIVERWGGHVSVDSEPGRGSTFCVLLPRAGQALEARPAPDTLVRQGNETILVVEDDGEVRTLVTATLRGSGYTVLEAAHGGEALNLVQRRAGAIDLLVTDLEMPNMSGHELARRLESLSGGMKVLYLSPADAPELDPLTLSSRVREVLDGPVTLSARS